jgi:hypothetical protein
MCVHDNADIFTSHSQVAGVTFLSHLNKETVCYSCNLPLFLFFDLQENGEGKNQQSANLNVYSPQSSRPGMLAQPRGLIAVVLCAGSNIVQ